MNKIQRIEPIGKELAELKEQVKAEKPKAFPQQLDMYWAINSSGSVGPNRWIGHQTDYRRKEFGNIYQTSAEAEEAVRKRKAEIAYKNKIKEVNGNWKPNWKDATTKKQHLYYDHPEKRIDVYYMLFHQLLDNTEYFRPEVSEEQLAELKRLYADWKGIE